MTTPRVWCLLRDQFAHVRPVENTLGGRAQFVYDADWDPDAMVRERPDVVMCVNDWPYDVARCLDAARQTGIPSLALQDGILEWRCQYENPLFGNGGGAPQHQPVLADYIACIGQQSARQITAWGNDGRAIATGMPRLDHLLSRPKVARNGPGRTVLVMTAKNPGFTEEQRAITLESLRDLKAYLSARADITALWRVGREVARQLGIENLLNAMESAELARVVERADAVVTTPSTAMLEAMILDRPVAALDYHNVPRFVPTAWTISARQQIAPVLDEILSPSARKLAYQNDVLHDCLDCRTPAAPRVADLILRLATREGVEALGIASPESSRPLPALDALYPDEPIFAERDLRSLQVRLTRLQKENESLRRRVRLRDVARRLLRRHPSSGRETQS